MKFNFLVLFLSALIPLAIGFVWYHKKVFGTTWLRVSNISEEQTKNTNMALTFGLTYLFSLFIALAIHGMVIHQMHIYSIVVDEPAIKDPNSELNLWIKGFMDKYGNNFRTFKHGAFHGFLTGIFVALPIIGINALFERKSFKYVAINVGYWTLCIALMGGVICEFAK
ncbi:MAG TPA: DUF1761 domain-containing protein [Cytophagales bacterium]|nr:DUF1761 domain-containing protein [Cytophagales bacterium]